ncbi:MAG: hypothetical protein ACOZAR_00400 [Patescibacteria group bacterium]
MSTETQKPKEEIRFYGIPENFEQNSDMQAADLQAMYEKKFLIEKTLEDGTKQYEKIIGRGDDLDQMQAIKNAWDFRVELVGDENLKKNQKLKGMFFNEMDKNFANQFLYEMDQRYEVGRQENKQVDWDKWAKNAERLFDKKKYDGQIETMKTVFGPEQSKLLDDFMKNESKLFIPSTLGLPNLTGKTGGEKPTQAELVEALKKRIAESGLTEENQRKILKFIGNWHNMVIDLSEKTAPRQVAMTNETSVPPTPILRSDTPTEKVTNDGSLPGGNPPVVSEPSYY